jgi:hypothetical protein
MTQFPFVFLSRLPSFPITTDIPDCRVLGARGCLPMAGIARTDAGFGRLLLLAAMNTHVTSALGCGQTFVLEVELISLREGFASGWAVLGYACLVFLAGRVHAGSDLDMSRNLDFATRELVSLVRCCQHWHSHFASATWPQNPRSVVPSSKCRASARVASREEEGRRLCRTTQGAAEDNIKHDPTFTANRAAINIARLLIGECIPGVLRGGLTTTIWMLSWSK